MAITVNLPSVPAAHAGGARTIEATGRPLGEAVADEPTRNPALGPRLRDAQGKPYPFVTSYLTDQKVRFRGGFAVPVQAGHERTVDSAGSTSAGAIRSTTIARPRTSPIMHPMNSVGNARYSARNRRA